MTIIGTDLHRDVNELHEITDKSHDGKADSHSFADLEEL